jgi:hypothetical protein
MIVQLLICFFLFIQKFFCISFNAKNPSKNNPPVVQDQNQQQFQKKSVNNNHEDSLTYRELQNWWNNLPKEDQENLQLITGAGGAFLTYAILKNMFTKHKALKAQKKEELNNFNNKNNNNQQGELLHMSEEEKQKQIDALNEFQALKQNRQKILNQTYQDKQPDNNKQKNLKEFTDTLKQYYEGCSVLKAQKKDLNTQNFDVIITEGKGYLDFKKLQTQFSELSIPYMEDINNNFQLNKEKFLNAHREYNKYFEQEEKFQGIGSKQDCGFITIALAEYNQNFEQYKNLSPKEAVKKIIEASSFLDPKKNGGPREGQTDFNEILSKNKNIDIDEIGKGMIPIQGYNEEYIQKIHNHLINQLGKNSTAAFLVSNVKDDLVFENKQNDKLDQVWENIKTQLHFIGSGHWSTLIKENNQLFIAQTIQVEDNQQMIPFKDYMKRTSGEGVKKIISTINLDPQNLKEILNHSYSAEKKG